MLTAGGTFDFNGLFDPTLPLDKARIDGSALEALEIASLLNVAERVAAWRNLFASAEARPQQRPGLGHSNRRTSPRRSSTRLQ